MNRVSIKTLAAGAVLTGSIMLATGAYMGVGKQTLLRGTAETAAGTVILSLAAETLLRGRNSIKRPN